MTADSNPRQQPDRKYAEDSPAGGRISRRALLLAGGAYLGLEAVRPRGWQLLAAPAPRTAGTLPPATPALGPPVCVASSRTSYPPLLERFIAKLDPAADVFPTEQYVAEIEKVLAGWSAALTRSAHDVEAIRGNLAAGLAASPLGPSATVLLRTTGPLRIERRSFAPPPTTDREGFLANWAAYVLSFASLETVELEIYGIRITAESPLQVDTDVHFNLVGTGKDETREQRVGTWMM